MIAMVAATARRASGVEIMDAGGYDHEEIRLNLADLRFYNAWLGGARLMAREIGRMLGANAPRRLTLLDVATGSADIPAALARWCGARGIAPRIAGLDANPDVLAEARRYLAASGRADGQVSLVRAAADRLPYADGSVDVAFCSNFLHHLDGDSALAALREMGRVSRLGVVVIDLMRSRAALASVYLLTRVTTSNRLTRHDGPLSVSRAFTPGELASLAAEAGLPGAAVRRAGPVRMVLRWRRP